MNKILKISKLFSVICIIFTSLISSQHLYYSNGDKYELKISDEYVLVKFRTNVPEKEQDDYIFSLIEVDKNKENLELSNKFIALPLEPKTDIKTFIITQKESNKFEAVFPVYADTKPLLMYDKFIVRFKSDVAEDKIKEFGERHGVEFISTKDVQPLQYTFKWTSKAVMDPLELSNMYFDSLDCEWAIPDFLIKGEFFSPNDPYFNKQYYLHNTGQTPIPGEGSATYDVDIDALEAWNITKGSSSIKIAVIDMGVQAHEDLPSWRLFEGYDFAGADCWISNDIDSDPAPDGNEAHGMACAGIIAATHNNLGIAGIAPNCKIIPIKIGCSMGHVEQSITNIGDAIDYAWEHDADVISGSWGLWYQYHHSIPPPMYPIRDAINRAMNDGRGGLGTVCIFAAGNGGGTIYDYVAFPANMPGVVAVGAIDKSGDIQYYSPTDSDINIVTPSGNIDTGPAGDRKLRGNIWSIEISGERGWNPGDYQTYQFVSYATTPAPKGDSYPPGNYTARFGGTSASAPQVAGVAALILSLAPSSTQNEVTSWLKHTADDIGLPANEQGSGRLNAYSAIEFKIVPPETPNNFNLTTVSVGSTKRPKLTWDANIEIDLNGYKIERKVDNGNWSTIYTASTNETSYTDMEVVIWASQNYQTAYYRIRAFDADYLFSPYSPIKSVDFHIMFKQVSSETLNAIKMNKIFQNAPNPFNPTTTINYQLKGADFVSLKVYDVLGKEIITLVNENKNVGYYETTFDASNLPSGIYIYKINIGNFTDVKKMLLMK